MGKQATKLTQGPVAKNIVFFALPLVGTGLLQHLYHTVDLIFVGRFVGIGAGAAVGASAMLVTTLIGFFSGLSVGASVVAANYFGADDHQKLNRTIHTAVAVAFVGGCLFSALGYLLAPTFLGWLNTPAEVFPLAVSYIRVYFLSLVSIVTYNIASGIARGLGNSKAPMVYQFVGGLMNVAGNVLFVWVLGWGVKGSALATLLSNTLAAILTLGLLRRLDEAYRLKIRRIRIDRDQLAKIMYIGLPAGIQSVLITFSNLVVQFHINSMGVTAIAAFTAYFRVEQFVYLPIAAFGQAMTTFSGQNVGAGLLGRVRQGVKTSLIMGIIVTVFMSLTLMALNKPAFGLFYDDPSVIALGRQLIFITFPFYFLYVVLEVLASTIRGAGKPFPPSIIVLANLCVLRTTLLAVVGGLNQTPQGVAMVYPITWACTAACLTVYYHKANWLRRWT
jgi:putative MATE family efflux protein